MNTIKEYEFQEFVDNDASGFDDLKNVPFSGSAQLAADSSKDPQEKPQSYQDCLEEITKDIQFKSRLEVNTVLADRPLHERNQYYILPTTWLDSISMDENTPPDVAEQSLAKAKRAVEVTKMMEQEEKQYSADEIQDFKDNIVDFIDKNNIIFEHAPGHEFWETDDTDISTENWTFWCRHYRDIPKWPRYQELMEKRRIQSERDAAAREEAIKKELAEREAERKEREKQEAEERSNFISSHPEVFSNPDIQAIDDACRTVAEHMKQDILQSIHNIYDLGNPELGDSLLVDYLASTLHIEKKPTVVYDPKCESSWGSFGHRSKTLTLYGYGGSDSADRMQTIAHEMWHARQHELEEDASNSRGELYKMNFQYYIKPSDDDEGYYHQLVEKEARRFERVFKDVMVDGVPSVLPHRVEEYLPGSDASRPTQSSGGSLVDWGLSREDAISNFIKKMKENI